MVGQAIGTLRRQARAEKFALPRWRRKAAVRKRCIGHGQGCKTVTQQLVKIYLAIERGAAHLLVTVCKTRFGVAHACGQLSKNLGIGFSLTYGRNRGLIQCYIGVAVA